MKQTFHFLLLIFFIASLFSCSLSIEKRRYRPGYHVDIVQKNQGSNFYQPSKKESAVEVERQENKLLPPQQIPSSPKGSIIHHHSDNAPQISVKNSFTHNNQSPKNKLIAPSKTRLLKKINSTTETKVEKGKLIAAWVLGIIGIIIALCSIAGFSVGYGFGAVIGGALLGLGALFGIIALIVRFTKPKEEREKIKKEKLEKNPYKPVDASFIKAGFIFSIITASFALVGFVLGFFVYPMGIIGWIISLISVLASIVVIILGFRAKKDDKGIKPKLTIVLGFVALILAIFGMIILFL